MKKYAGLWLLMQVTEQVKHVRSCYLLLYAEIYYLFRVNRYDTKHFHWFFFIVGVRLVSMHVNFVIVNGTFPPIGRVLSIFIIFPASNNHRSKKNSSESEKRFYVVHRCTKLLHWQNFLWKEIIFRFSHQWVSGHVVILNVECWLKYQNRENSVYITFERKNINSYQSANEKNNIQLKNCFQRKTVKANSRCSHSIYG